MRNVVVLRARFANDYDDDENVNDNDDVDDDVERRHVDDFFFSLGE